MSAKEQRARRRAALLEAQRATFEEARTDPTALAALLPLIAASSLRLWAMASHDPRYAPLTDDERAMIAQAVAPHLAAPTPGSVHRRHLKP